MNKYQIGIEEYKNGKSIKNICKEYYLTPKLLRNRLLLEGIEIRGKSSTQKHYSNDVINNILIDYKNKISIRKISIKYNINRHDISYILKQNNINVTKRLDKLNEDYFEIIDTEHKAYWLGFLYADGCISKNNSSIELTLKYSDKYHLERFKQDIESDTEITDGYRQCKISTNPEKQLRYARFVITSLKMKNDLIKLGCFSAKSLILKFPSIEQVPNHLITHFIRGYFDGDGCISIDKSKTLSIAFQVTGTYDVLKNIKDYFSIKAEPRQVINVYDLRCKGNVKALGIFDILYENATIYLQRKYDIYYNFKFQYLPSKVKTHRRP